VLPNMALDKPFEARVADLPGELRRHCRGAPMHHSAREAEQPLWRRAASAPAARLCLGRVSVSLSGLGDGR